MEVMGINLFTATSECHCADSHQIRGCSKTFCKEILYRISWKSEERLVFDIVSQTDGEANRDGLDTRRSVLVCKEVLTYTVAAS
jgi:hypothetical protein